MVLLTVTFNLSSLQNPVDFGLPYRLPLYADGLAKNIVYFIQYILNFKYVLVTDKIYFVKFLGDKNGSKNSN